MKFGSVDNPETVDFTLPPTHPDTITLLRKHKKDQGLEVFVGCAKWNKQDLKGFYPRGTKDELTYYATQFNSIELNGTFYNSPDKQQVETWKAKTPADFKFFPKVPQTISHYGRLLNVDEKMTAFCDAIVLFEEKLGMSFLQLHDNFKPKDFERLATFVKKFAGAVPLAVEVRNAEWFADQAAREKLYSLLETEKVANVMVDTAGRRDMLHMRLTTPTAFVRYVGANHPTDKSRLDDWVGRIQEWRDAGLQSLYFFVHQNVEIESPLLSTYFIEALNNALGLQIRSPQHQLFT
ncbi:DUF72 domain-containing protein [Parapedobacter sp. ISTM3]|uniref:DUF72 domain-containing protein n=1 Tax=Parapedobacter sp. ISTM3 TaxID=2800130 RepID=UPI001905CFC4|nr:DUF72 domain-containing protein [Parapedobacter sp. ISTM3]MBK1440354.1 DUF72 domain-containing protein [Parapedobacter sp. ISTM3]